MFVFENTTPYPCFDEIAPDEDGVGYGLRLASANAITFHQLAQALASPGHLYLPHAKAPELAFMFGATPALVAKAMVRRYFDNGITIADYAGHTFYRPQHLRQTRPQLCPQCIASEHRAFASWSLTMMCCCTRHATVLIDRCACGRPVRWRRIDLQTCRCGHPFIDSAEVATPASAGALAICQHIEYLLGVPHFKLRRPDETVLGLFDEVSLDTFLRIIWAMGVVEGNEQKSHPKSANFVPGTDSVVRVVERAYQRLSELVTTRRAPTPNIWRQSIDLLADELTHGADQRIVLSILRRLRTSSPRQRQAAQRAHLKQLSFFGDDL
ncbi:MAG: TniQ family protein [Pseudomonadota bacterium]|nr:TniQ family protein [Pseudomonadota bacterium]